MPSHIPSQRESLSLRHRGFGVGPLPYRLQHVNFMHVTPHAGKNGVEGESKVDPMHQPPHTPRQTLNFVQSLSPPIPHSLCKQPFH